MRVLSIFPLAGLLLIVLLIFMKVVSLRSKGISLHPEKSKTPQANLILYPVFIMLLLVWLAVLTCQTFDIQLFPCFKITTNLLVTSKVLQATGASIILFSVLIMGITLVHFKTSLRFGLNKNNQGRLVTKGIFSLSRNPFFLSLNLFFIGQAMMFTGIVNITMALLAVIGIHFFILKEEKFLAQHYKDQYTAYRQKVGRYF